MEATLTAALELLNSMFIVVGSEVSHRALGVGRFHPSSSSHGVGRSFRDVCLSRIAHIGSAIPFHR
jgi:hypothetical protein